MRAIRIEKLSPLTVELLVASVAVTSGALWTFAQIIEKVANWKLNRQKLRLEVQKLEREERRYQEPTNYLREKVEERGAAWILGSLIGRLEDNPLNLVDIEIITEKTWKKKNENARAFDWIRLLHLEISSLHLEEPCDKCHLFSQG